MAEIQLKSVSKRWGSFVGVVKFDLTIGDQEFLVLDDRGGFLMDVNISIDKEAYQRHLKLVGVGIRNMDGTVKGAELTREELKGISLQVSGTTVERTE